MSRLKAPVRKELRPVWKAIPPTTAAARIVHSTSIRMSLDWMLKRLRNVVRGTRTRRRALSRSEPWPGASGSVIALPPPGMNPEADYQQM